VRRKITVGKAAPLAATAAAENARAWQYVARRRPQGRVGNFDPTIFQRIYWTTTKNSIFVLFELTNAKRLNGNFKNR